MDKLKINSNKSESNVFKEINLLYICILLYTHVG